MSTIHLAQLLVGAVIAIALVMAWLTERR